MGETIGFICYNCGYQEKYPNNTGMKAAVETSLYKCEECEALTKISQEDPKCGNCKSNNVKQMMDSKVAFICPACNDHVFE